MPYQITVRTLDENQENPLSLLVKEGDSLLAASERCFNKAIAVGCRRGGCGVCRVKILSGQYRSRIMSRSHITEDNINEGVVLACCVFPESDMKIVHETSKKLKNYLLA